MNNTISWIAAKKNNWTKIIISSSIERFERAIANFSLVENTPFLDAQQFDWIGNLESNWLKIRQELDLVLNDIDTVPNFQDISKAQYSITKDNLWKTYFFYAYSNKITQNCERCPQTTALIEKIPGMKTAFFSILLPHKHIPKHRGPYKGVLRYHLGLIVPQPNHSCRIRVAKNIAYWKEGKSLVFDDSYEHEAWNDSNSIRVVLFVDFVRPMYFPFSTINHFLIKVISFLPLVRDGIKRQNAWNKISNSHMTKKN